MINQCDRRCPLHHVPWANPPGGAVTEQERGGLGTPPLSLVLAFFNSPQHVLPPS